MRKEDLCREVRLSIITPYYKCLKYIKELASVLVPQLREDVEWIIVDDGCGDDFSFIDSEYVRLYYLAENSGCAGIPRNKGIDVASGEYITFVDADDLVSSDFVEKILEKIDEGFDYCMMSWKSDTFNVDIRNGRPEWNCSVWGIVYHRDLIGDKRFNNLRVGEDYVFNQDVLLYGGVCKLIPEYLYYYRNNEEGIMSNER